MCNRCQGDNRVRTVYINIFECDASPVNLAVVYLFVETVQSLLGITTCNWMLLTDVFCFPVDITLVIMSHPGHLFFARNTTCLVDWTKKSHPQDIEETSIIRYFYGYVKWSGYNSLYVLKLFDCWVLLYIKYIYLENKMCTNKEHWKLA